MPEPLVCDFCRRPPVLSYPCASFALPTIQYISNGPWAACQACADLIDAGRWTELRDRAVADTADGEPLRPVYLTIVTAWMEQLHSGFRRFRLVGPPAPIRTGGSSVRKHSA